MNTTTDTCKTCRGTATIRMDYYPAPVWQACPKCSAPRESQ